MTIISQEHVAVKALKDDSFLEMGDSEALEIALQLQRLLRGQDSLIEKVSKVDKNAQRMSDEMSKLKERTAEMETFAKTFEDNRAKYENMWRDRSESVSADVRAQSQAETMQQVQQMTQSIRANRNVDDMQKKAFMKNAPKVKITRPGRPITTPQGLVMEAEVVSLNGMQYIMPPNVEVEVPRPVVDYLESQDLDRAVLAEKKKLLDADNIKQDTAISRGMQAIDQKYGIKSEIMPVASRV